MVVAASVVAAGIAVGTDVVLISSGRSLSRAVWYNYAASGTTGAECGWSRYGSTSVREALRDSYLIVYTRLRLHRKYSIKLMLA